MASKVKEKVQLLKKEDIRCLELIKQFKKFLNLWFMYGTIDNQILKELLNSCVEIILHGLRSTTRKFQTKRDINTLVYDSSPTTSTAPLQVNNNNKNDNSNLKLNEVHKIIDDFEWVRNAVIIRRNSNTATNVLSAEERTSNTSPLHNCCLQNKIQKQILQPSFISHVTKWLNQNLTEHNLCGFVQYLVNDKELLEEHYHYEALLRQNKYVNILVMGLTAFETKQYGLISQIEEVLKGYIEEAKQDRSSLQPNLVPVTRIKSNLNQLILVTSNQNYSGLPLTAIRKTQSLPELINKHINLQDDTVGISSKRPICKTLGTIKYMTTSPKNIPQTISQRSDYDIKPTCSNETASSAGSFMYNYADNLPTTSQTSSNRSKSPLSNYTFSTNKSATSSLRSTSESSFNSNHTAKCIQLINTDDIKIWTDHSWEMKQKRKQLKLLEPTASCAVPTSMAATAKSCKSFSPLNSFFSSLFTTPPSYTSWFIDNSSQKEQETTETAIDSIIPDSNNPQGSNSILFSQHQSAPLSHTSTVFDKFLPIDGKKVRCRKSQNLFDDVSTTTTLDRSGINKSTTAGDFSIESPSSTLSPGFMPLTSKNCQSLTRYLQLSHLSRNNTDLEKENAHFRISEAIISAIEHIKWNKLETSRNISCSEDTSLATDCLAPSDPLPSKSMLTSSNEFEGEHVPYAELEEVSYDLLSAEVVGLSLISKFDEKHLPKVSELKWLVADDDTPQKLLPMPDLSTSTNPDEHVIKSATRGTRYWAPPRQQIIFTDHPLANRKELLKKQNYRCAGCGMRVSQHYIQSFRYCTYLGKYHCTGCHRNQISTIPAKILQAWDFKCYPVSVFAYRLLEQMYAYPLFFVPDLNPALYFRCKSLLKARTKRLQLKYVKDFILMCRFAMREQSYFESVPDYITADIDNWSMSDFMDTRTKCLHRSIDELINKCENHIFSCVLCSARGFLCEYCHDDVVIYPWGSRVERCDDCGTCFHRKCWKSLCGKCCRCQRIGKRRDEMNDVT